MIIKQLIERARMTGECIPALNYAADVAELLAMEADTWTHRTDDAMRIPDMLRDHARLLREEARERVVQCANEQQGTCRGYKRP